MCHNFSYIKQKKGVSIKTLYLIRHAKSDWSDGSLKDFERCLKKEGHKNIDTIGSYLALQNIRPDHILSSAALRAQLTADELAKKIDFTSNIQYMNELYLSKPEMIMNVLSLQEDKNDTIFLIGHNPALSELANILQKENFTKFPSLGVLAINLNIDSWMDIHENSQGKIDFFIFPKQFKYYIPKQIRTKLA